MSTWHVGWAGQTLPAAPATIKPVRRKQQRRQEAYGPDWTGYLDALVSRYKDGEEWWTPIGVGDVGARQRGEDGLYLNNETELAFIREASRMLIRKSPLAQGLIEGLCNYIISDGYSYKAVAKEQVRKQALQTTGTTDDDALAKLAAACQEVLDDFHEDNHWADLEEELFWRSLEDGEFFLCEHEGDDGELQYRIIEPEQVAQRPGDPREIWSWGVGTPADDVADVQEYSVRWNAYGQEEWEDIPAEQIIHFKRNSRRNMKRGVPDFAFDTERLLRTVGKLYYNMGVGSSLQAAIAMVMQFATGTEAEITSMQGGQKSETITHPLRRANWDQVDYDAGTVQYVPEGQEWVDPPFGNNATAHVGVGQACCQVVANRWNAPGWFASGSMEDNNFASSVVAETPFNRRGKREQGRYRRVFKRPYVRALEVAVKSGRLPANTLELIEVQVTAPSLTVRNQLEEANENKIYVEMGVKSIAYVQEEKGIDGDRVAADRRDEQEVRNEQMKAEAEIQAKANPQPTTNAAAGEPPQGETKPRQEGLGNPYHKGKGTGGGQFTTGGGHSGSADDGSDDEEGPSPSAMESRKVRYSDPRAAYDLQKQINVLDKKAAHLGRLAKHSGEAGLTTADKHHADFSATVDEAHALRKQLYAMALPPGELPDHHPGALPGTSVSVKPTQERAFNGSDPVEIKTKLSKQETGHVGEAVITSYLKSQGFHDTQPMNTQDSRFPIDLLEDHRPTEVKAGLASNGKSAQQWRLTFSQENDAEKKAYAKMTAKQREAWNAEKQARIHVRKQEVVKSLEKKYGQKVNPRTMTVVLNPDTKTADIYSFDGFHDRIGWTSPEARAAYVGSVTYDH